MQRVGRVGFGVNRDDAFILGAGDPRAKLRRCAHDLVRRAVDRRARLLRSRGGEVSGRSSVRGGPGLARRGSRDRHHGGRLCRRLAFSFQQRHALAARPSRRADEARVRLDRGHVDAADLGDAAGQRGELHRLAKRDEPLAVEIRRRERLERRLDRHVPIQGDELFRHSDKLDGVGIGQHVASLRLFDLARTLKQRLEIPVFGNELSRGLESDARRARHVVGRIAGERLDVDHPVGADAEIFDHLGRPEAPLLAGSCDAWLARSGVVHRDPRIDELHEVLVCGDDKHLGAGLARLSGIGGDDVVGLVAALLDRNHAEGRDGRPHQRELRHQFVRRFLPMRLVGRVDVAPERILRLVEDHGEMSRLETSSPVADELQHFGGEQPHRAGRQAVHPIIVLLILADRLIIGAKDERRAVDEKNMVAGADRAMGLGHGHHISDTA